MRINARLDENRSRKFDYLTRATSQGTTEIVKRAIDAYYDLVTESRPNAAEVLASVSFIGCGEADADLSSKTKSELRGILGDKIGDGDDHR